MADGPVLDLGIAGLADVVEIGHGAFGTVYKARQPNLHRHVAVKVLLERGSTSEAARRFEREGEALGRLSSHPNIVTIFDVGVTGDGRQYIRMELCAGGSLQSRIDRHGPLPWADVLRLGVQVAGALETAHRAGFVHRDIKPANILLSELGDALLGDFGVAGEHGKATLGLGGAFGTLAHAPPEVLAGGRPDEASDLFSLGSTLYTALAGREPYYRPGDDQMLLATRMHEPPPDLRRWGVPGPVADAVVRCLAFRPADRPRRAYDLGVALNDAQRATGQPTDRLPVVPPSVRVLDEPSGPPPAAPAPASAARADDAVEGEVRRATFELAVIGGPGAGLRLRLGEGATVVGRSSTAALVLPDPDVSRHHALVHVDGGGVEVEDLGSRNGTLVDGERVTERRPVAVGQVLTLGETLLALRHVAPEESKPGEASDGGPRSGPTEAAAGSTGPSGSADERSARRGLLGRLRRHAEPPASDADDAVATDLDDRSTVDVAALSEIVAAPTSRLWERRPRDLDFLSLRLGLRVGGAGRPPEVLVSLPRAGVLGIAGPAGQRHGALRSLLLQVAVLHRPQELSLMVDPDALGTDDWQALRALPHSATASTEWRSATVADVREVAGGFAGGGSEVADRTHADRAVVLVAHAPVATDLVRRGPDRGVYVVCTAETERELPGQCGTVLSFTDPLRPRAVVRRRDGDVDVRVDQVPADVFGATVRLLAE